MKELSGPSLGRTRTSTFFFFWRAEMAGSGESTIWYSIDTRIKMAEADCSRLYDGICTSFVLFI